METWNLYIANDKKLTRICVRIQTFSGTWFQVTAFSVRPTNASKPANNDDDKVDNSSNNQNSRTNSQYCLNCKAENASTVLLCSEISDVKYVKCSKSQGLGAGLNIHVYIQMRNHVSICIFIYVYMYMGICEFVFIYVYVCVCILHTPPHYQP